MGQKNIIVFADGKSDEDILKGTEFCYQQELRRWLLDAYTTFNSLSQNVALKDRILVEEIPSSREHLTDILDAMRGNKVMEMTYRNFVGVASHTFLVAPYCVRMAQKRWYVLALSVHEDRLRVYALDRIEDIKTTDETFKLPKDFNAKKYFSSFFGVVCDDTIKEEKIVLRAGKYHQNYMRSLPPARVAKGTIRMRQLCRLRVAPSPDIRLLHGTPALW